MLFTYLHTMCEASANKFLETWRRPIYKTILRWNSWKSLLTTSVSCLVSYLLCYCFLVPDGERLSCTSNRQYSNFLFSVEVYIIKIAGLLAWRSFFIFFIRPGWSMIWIVYEISHENKAKDINHLNMLSSLLLQHVYDEASNSNQWYHKHQSKRSFISTAKGFYHSNSVRKGLWFLIVNSRTVH